MACLGWIAIVAMVIMFLVSKSLRKFALFGIVGFGILVALYGTSGCTLHIDRVVVIEATPLEEVTLEDAIDDVERDVED